MTKATSVIRFCSLCGSPTTERVPDDDNRLRAVCTKCGHVNYVNPKIVVGTIATWEDSRILLAKRAIEPRHGLWTLPAGYMEVQESAPQGAAREALEEANARVEIQDLYTVYSVPHISQVYMLFRGRLLDPDVSAGPESLDAKLVTEEEIPWNDLAFSMVRLTLKHFIADRKAGTFVTRFGDIHPPER